MACQACRTVLTVDALSTLKITCSPGTWLMSKYWRENGSLYLWEGGKVDSRISPDECRARALDCMIKAETLEDSQQKAAMFRYAEWWNRLADYRARMMLAGGQSDP